jgi:hypothetical protein
MVFTMERLSTPTVLVLHLTIHLLTVVLVIPVHRSLDELPLVPVLRVVEPLFS